MKPLVEKLITFLKTEGINFSYTDGNLDNIVLTKGDIVKKIAYQCFYRFSGISVFYKDGKKKGEINTIDITDDMFINEYMKVIILLKFKIKENE